MSYVTKERVVFWGAAVLTLALFAANFAYAADPNSTRVTIDYGKAIDAVLENGGELAFLVISGILGTFAQPVWRIMQISRLDQLLKNALYKAIEDAREDVRDNTITVDVRNEVVASALQYAVNNGAGLLIKWAGGREGIRDKLTARFAEAFGEWLRKQKAA